LRERLNLFWRVYGNRRMLVVLLLGFSSGLPLALSASTLSIWLTEAGVSKAAIGIFAAIGTPYAIKFLWAPLVDGLRIPVLSDLFGRRRSWLLTTQGLLALGIAALGFADPTIDPWMTAFCALIVATISATQDIVYDAYRVEILPQEEQGAGAGAAVLGYRFGMIAASAGALLIAEVAGWHASYMVMAALVGVGVFATLLGREPEVAEQAATASEKKDFISWVKHYVISPFADFMKHKHWLAVLAFIVLYKFSDAFMGVMTNPFLIELGFSKGQIGTVVKFFGLWATILGSVLGGIIVYRLGLIRSLWICGFMHMLTNLLFVGQAWMGPNIYYLALCITLENGSGGMGTAAFVAFISGLCNRHFTGTQYALLSSLAAFGRTWLSTPAGVAAQTMGWPVFFFFSSLLAIPGLVLLWWLTKRTQLSATA